MKNLKYLWVVIFIFALSGCTGRLYNTNADNDSHQDSMITIDVESIEQEPLVDLTENEAEDDITGDESNVDVNNPENSGDGQSEVTQEDNQEDVIIEEETVDQSNHLNESEIEALFVNQFSNEVPYTLDLPLNELDGTGVSWSFKRNKDHLPVTGYYDIDISLYGAYFIKPTEEKVVYLTFDEGYENGFTPTILDILNENNVQATFFITGDYIDREPELVQRMANEGHIVGNHSENHPDFSTIDENRIYDELTTLSTKYEQLTGQEIAPFFRPPSGKYSERALYLIRKLGYRTIFWSMAYKDYETANQPGKEAAYKHVLDNYHNGAIILLHAVSESNTQALDDIIKDLKNLGYRFGSLYELE